MAHKNPELRKLAAVQPRRPASSSTGKTKPVEKKREPKMYEDKVRRIRQWQQCAPDNHYPIVGGRIVFIFRGVCLS